MVFNRIETTANKLDSGNATEIAKINLTRVRDTLSQVLKDWETQGFTDREHTLNRLEAMSLILDGLIQDAYVDWEKE